MFSFKTGFPIARIDGGEYDDKMLRIQKDLDGECDIDVNGILKYISEKEIREIVKQRKGTCSQKDVEELLRILKEDPDTISSIPDFAQIKGHTKNNIKKRLELTKGEMVPLPNQEKRDTIYVSGPNGCGKSTFCSLYMKEWRKDFKKSPIYLFSEKPKDECLDKIKGVQRVLLDSSLIDDPITLDELAGSLCVFDDIDSIADRKLKRAVYDLMNSILKVGRSRKIYCLITTHMQSNFAETRVFIAESEYVVVFPNVGSRHYLDSFAKKYLGLSNSDIKRLHELKTHWALIHKDVPQYVLYEKGAYIL